MAVLFPSRVVFLLLDTKRTWNSQFTDKNLTQQKTLTMLIRVHASLREDKKPGGKKSGREARAGSSGHGEKEESRKERGLHEGGREGTNNGGGSGGG